jgi:hypothetical protein
MGSDVKQGSTERERESRKEEARKARAQGPGARGTRVHGRGRGRHHARLVAVGKPTAVQAPSHLLEAPWSALLQLFGGARWELAH